LPYEAQFGDLLIVLATLFWAGENTISKYTLRTLSPQIVAFGRMGIGSFFILLFLAFTGGFSSIGTLNLVHWQWVVISAILLFGYVTTWYTGLKYVKASVATTILLLGSPITLFLTLIFQGQSFSENQIIGTFLIFLGIIVAIGFKNVLEAFRGLPKIIYGRA
jgi:drug/metabolite transporter (DMT)-like permease